MNDIWTFLAFPLNLLLAVLLAVGLLWLRKSHPHSQILRFLHSPAATFSSILLLIISCIWIGVSGDRNFVQSILFVVVLLYIQIVLFLITLRGWKRADGKVRWRFLFLHLGLLLAIGAGFWGSPDSFEYRTEIKVGQTSRIAYKIDKTQVTLPYELTLRDVSIKYDVEGKILDYEAIISINESKPITISVNNPLTAGLGQDIYIANVSAESCVLQIVVEPWRYFALAGIIIMLAGAFLLFINGPRR